MISHDCNPPCFTLKYIGPLDWVIVGGESGPQSRPFDLAWGRSIVAQCQAAGVSVFVKQLGANPIGYVDDGQTAWLIDAHGLHDRKGGNLNEWPEELRVRDYPRSTRTDLEQR